jgi:hypothetical protein
MHRIRTEAFIPAAPDDVWRILADFDRYHEWNPLNLRAKGEARLGAKIPMTFRNPARPGATISQVVTVVACDPGRALAWAGWVPLLFRGRHFFTLEPEGQGTRLWHGEDLRGLLAMGFSRDQVARDFVPAYAAVNKALAARLGVACAP